MEKRYLTLETLESELRDFEARYHTSSDELVAQYYADAVPIHIPRRDAFAWASTCRHIARLRTGVPQPA